MIIRIHRPENLYGPMKAEFFGANATRKSLMVEFVHRADGAIRSAKNTNNRLLVPADPLFWLDFVEGAEFIDHEFTFANS